MSETGTQRLPYVFSIVIAIMGVANLPPALGAPGDIYNLGALGGTFGSFGEAVNGSGDVAGYAYLNGNTARHAFRYSGTPGSGGTMRDLGTLGGTGSDAYGINDSGQVVGYSNTANNAAVHAFRYTGTPGAGGAMADLGTLGGTRSEGLSVNNSGQVAGDSYLTGSSTYHAFRYTGTPGAGEAMLDLGTLGGVYSAALAINIAAEVAGWSETGKATHAFRYSGTPGAGGAMVDLGTLGGTDSYARGINDHGQVTGDSRILGDGATHAFRYTGAPNAGGAMVDLGTNGGANSSGAGVNNAGYVVGVAGNHATLWQTDWVSTAVDLDVWLDATNPAQGAHWTLIRAQGINDAGMIAGFGLYTSVVEGIDEQYRAFALDASSLVPEPSGLALMLPTAWRLLRRRRRTPGRPKALSGNPNGPAGDVLTSNHPGRAAKWLKRSGCDRQTLPA